MKRALLVVAKQPAPGQTKTRLCPPLNSEQAAALYECFLRDTLDLMRTAQKHVSFQPIISYLPETATPYFHEIAPDFELLSQQGEGLAERLNHALTHCLTEQGYDQAVIMDSDSPTLPAAYITQAFTTLNQADVSLGPCDDGGYYLIGLKQPAPELFLTVTMSTPDVTADTLARAAAAGLRVELLPGCFDIDYTDDLKRLMDELETLPGSVARHSRAFLAANAHLGTM